MKFEVEPFHTIRNQQFTIFDYDIARGMSKSEVLEVYENFKQVIETNFPSRNVWNYLSREHFLLYLDRYGREEILNMASPVEQPA